MWRSLSVDEHLRLVARGGADAAWTVDRVYQTFPRLAERRTNGGGAAVGRRAADAGDRRARCSATRACSSWTSRPRGSRPIIVDQVAEMLVGLGREGDIAVLLIEQNIGVATSVAETRRHHGQRPDQPPDAGRRRWPATARSQQQLLGVGRHAEDRRRPSDAAARDDAARERVAEVFQVVRGGSDRPRLGAAPAITAPSTSLPNRWALSDQELGRGVRVAAPASEAEPRGSRHVPALFDIRGPGAPWAAPRWWSAPSTPRAAN